jgi:cytochrome c oxidase cbb3-type subunit 2
MAGVFAVAATYVFFLLFAEFAFLALARADNAAAANLRTIMGTMAVGGISGSWAAVWRLGPNNFSRRLSLSYAACAAAAAAANTAAGLSAYMLVAVAVGFALGFNTVTLASGLRALLPAGRLGLGAGLGTGAAYALCNLPMIFTAEPRKQTWLCAGVALLAALALKGVRPGWREKPPVDRAKAWSTVGAFLTLVWMDSAVFYIIQQTPGLREGTWEGNARLWGIAFAHLGAAVGAGLLLGHGWLRGVMAAAWLLLASASLLFAGVLQVAGAGWLYAGGVSLYSSALVYYAASNGRPWIAASVFSVAGWMGSAFGIGMAQDLHGVPWEFVLVSGLGLGLAVRPWRKVVLAAAMLFFVRPLEAAEPLPPVTLGREVYIAEGCIHCHSQYLRPGVRADVQRWGPNRPLEQIRGDAPPLLGNRRQGPDLTNIGNRRSPEWNRLHLQSPRWFSPGSRMPSYAHLFAAGDGRGEALVAYLSSLGADTGDVRGQVVASWRPAPGTEVISAHEAGRLFQANCTPCHGSDGGGDGPVAERLQSRPADWRTSDWRRLSGGDEESLARLIKFGVPGTAMAGHESFTDGEILGLARHVRMLHK